jgi:hypothetical protein
MQQSHLLPMVFHWSKASFVRIHQLEVFGSHDTSYGSWGASIHKKQRVVHPAMLLSTKLGHQQQYCCKVHCFQQYRAICQHLTTQGKKSSFFTDKINPKDTDHPSLHKVTCWTFMCGFLKGKAFKSNCMLWPENRHYKHSSCNSSLPGDCKIQNREHFIHMWLQTKRPHFNPFCNWHFSTSTKIDT